MKCMWARTAEIILGLWLAASPVIFGTYGSGYGTAALDHAAGVIVLIFAAMSFSKTFGWAHYATLALSPVMVLSSYLTTAHPAPAHVQNRIAVGLVLMIFAILPNNAGQAPVPDREYSGGNNG
jgi:hypothetical protein